MEIKEIKAVYINDGDIRPVGKALIDKNGDLKNCNKCKKGIAFFEFESGKIKCTQCKNEE
jgi:uncharacterized protein (DUF983 family)